MTNVFPDYYKDFACVGSRCRHNCCIGWEIDIDSDTYKKYMKQGGVMGQRFRESCTEFPTPHFVCGSDGRCPFLNSDNLCDIIIELGEDHLCRICDAHPRFINELPGRLEYGLGLSCEEAARLILGKTDTVTFGCDGDFAQSDEVIALRDDLVAVFQNRKLSVDERCCEALSLCRIALPDRSMTEWVEFLLTLERLDTEWERVLSFAKISVDDLTEERFREHMEARAHEWEQLLVYLIWRHMATAADTEDASYRCAFAVLSYYILYAAALGMFSENGSFTFEDMTELCRLYSSELEYSVENTEAVLDELYFFCEVK